MRIVVECGVCSTGKEGRYKCPTCRLPYCSLDCFKAHKATPCAAPPAVGAAARSPPAGVLFAACAQAVKTTLGSQLLQTASRRSRRGRLRLTRRTKRACACSPPRFSVWVRPAAACALPH